MGLKITQVDAFTSQPFRGNPAAVCILPQPRNGNWMQLVAREMNLSETAFLHRQNEGYGLRRFTPTVEVALCGRVTLASAHVLWEEGYLSSDEQACFHTQSGLLTARRAAEWIELDFSGGGRGACCPAIGPVRSAGRQGGVRRPKSLLLPGGARIRRGRAACEAGLWRSQGTADARNHDHQPLGLRRVRFRFTLRLHAS